MKQFINRMIQFYTPIAIFCLIGVFVFCSLLQTQKGLAWFRSLGPLQETFFVVCVLLFITGIISVYGYKRLKAHITRWNYDGFTPVHPLTD